MRLPLLNFLKEVGCAKMARKRIKMNASTMTLAEVFPRFLTSKTAQGVSEKTLKTYRWHFHCIGKHLDLGISFEELTKERLELLIVSMRKSGLSHNSISSYMRVMRTFLKWSKEQGYTICTDGIEGIPTFWEKGCRYFKLLTPTGEQVEFCQIL